MFFVCYDSRNGLFSILSHHYRIVFERFGSRGRRTKKNQSTCVNTTRVTRAYACALKSYIERETQVTTN